eukprot:6125436-Amphidinium_carterae.1
MLCLLVQLASQSPLCGPLACIACSMAGMAKVIEHEARDSNKHVETLVNPVSQRTVIQYSALVLVRCSLGVHEASAAHNLGANDMAIRLHLEGSTARLTQDQSVTKLFVGKIALDRSFSKEPSEAFWTRRS